MAETKIKKITMPYYVAGEHNYPQVYFRHWENLKEMIERGAKAMGFDEVEFKEIK